jgi:xanthine dehydrogenase/oxidase
VSILIERDVDMSITGQRHAFVFDYSAGVSADGSLRFLDTQLYSNAGFSLDLSLPVIDRALFHCDNCYVWPALRANATICRTNQPSHTAFRGFGGPQGMVLTEMVLSHLAQASGIDIDTLRSKNLYKEGEKTHFGQRLEGFNIPSLLSTIHRTADVANRKTAVAAFNKDNRWRKRGLCVLPTKFGINFTAKFMNQGGALVHVYTDGSGKRGVVSGVVVGGVGVGGVVVSGVVVGGVGVGGGGGCWLLLVVVVGGVGGGWGCGTLYVYPYL